MRQPFLSCTKYLDINECCKDVSIVIFNPHTQSRIQKSNDFIMWLMSASIDYDRSGGHWTDHHHSGNSVTGFLQANSWCLTFLMCKNESIFTWKLFWELLMKALDKIFFCWCVFYYYLNRTLFIHIQFTLKTQYLFLVMEDTKISGIQLVAFFNVEKIHLKPFLMLLKYTSHIFFHLLSFEYTWELERSDLNWADQQSVLESMKLCGFTLSKSMAQSDKDWQEKNCTHLTHTLKHIFLKLM